MWQFGKKKHQNIKDLRSADHKWVLLESNKESDPLFVRFNDSAFEWAKHPELAIRVGFAIPLNLPSIEGLPNPDENEEFNDIEDGLIELMNGTGPSVQVLAITAGTFKEFVFYIKNAEGIEAAHKSAIAKFPSHEIQCMGKHDPEWEVYFDWKPA